MVQWKTCVGNITTNLTNKIDFTLPEFSVTKIVTWNYHAGEFSKGIYDLILGRDILTVLVLNLPF